jgi:hypothetical protein
MEGTMDADTLIADYLGRLRAASWPLAAGRREELQAEVAEHIDAALAQVGSRDEATVRNVLDRLGAPESIAAAEAGGGSVSPGGPPGFALVAAPSAGASPWGAVEIIAILFLTVGSVVLPFVGPVIGLAFVWGSSRWTTREKAIASAIVLVLLAVPILLLVAADAGPIVGGS